MRRPPVAALLPKEVDADGWPVGRPADVFSGLLNGATDTSGGPAPASPIPSRETLSGPPDGLEGGVPN